MGAHPLAIRAGGYEPKLAGEAGNVDLVRCAGYAVRPMCQRGASKDPPPPRPREVALVPVQELAGAAARLKSGDASARDGVMMYAQAYVQLLRQHIMKENNVLFTMAERMLPEVQGYIEARRSKRMEAISERIKSDA